MDGWKKSIILGVIAGCNAMYILFMFAFEHVLCLLLCNPHVAYCRTCMVKLLFSVFVLVSL